MNEKYIEKLRTPYFYIDTSIIIQNNFNFNSRKFKQLLHFIKNGRIKLLFNKITINEIKNNIIKKYEPIKQVANIIKKEVKILNNIQSISFYNLFSKEAIIKYEKELLNIFNTFLEESNFIEIPIYNEYTDKIFIDYFNKNPPFDMEKKKAEFPDAFVFYSLLHWSKHSNKEVYFITNDSDFTRIITYKKVKNIFVINSIETFLEIVLNSDPLKLSKIRKIISDNKLLIEKELKITFLNSGFFVNYAYAELDDIELQDLDFSIFHIISLTKKKVIIEAGIEITYKAYISYEDYENAIYDNEDNVWFYVENINTCKESTMTIDSLIIIDYDIEDKNINIEKIELANQNDIEIEFDPHDYDM